VRIGSNINRTVAKEIAQVERAKILRGEAGIGKKRKDVLFDKVALTFIVWAKTNKRPKTAACYTKCLQQLERSFAGRHLSQIQAFAVEKHKHLRVKEDAPVAANRDLACLRKMFNLARAWGMFEGSNPLSKAEHGDNAVKLLKEPKGRLRFLDPDEEDRLLENLFGQSSYSGARPVFGFNRRR
jgi:hypothetical protein